MGDGPGGTGWVGVIVFIVIVAIGVVLGITINEHLQALIDGPTTAATPGG